MTISSGQVVGVAAALLLSMTMSVFAQDTPENAKVGAAEFNNSCASCHGGDAKGAGFLTQLFKGVDPGDLTQLAKNNDGQFPSERVSDVIDGRAEVAAHGDRKMPVWGERYWETAMSEFGPEEFNEQRARNRVRELVVYLEAIQE